MTASSRRYLSAMGSILDLSPATNYRKTVSDWLSRDGFKEDVKSINRDIEASKKEIELLKKQIQAMRHEIEEINQEREIECIKKYTQFIKDNIDTCIDIKSIDLYGKDCGDELKKNKK